MNKPLEEQTLLELLENLELCNYECEAGPLINNVVYLELKTRVMIPRLLF